MSGTAGDSACKEAMARFAVAHEATWRKLLHTSGLSAPACTSLLA
jgi:hypothetical protein